MFSFPRSIRSYTSLISALLVALFFVSQAGQSRAETSNFVPVWFADKAQVSEDVIRNTVDQVRERNSNPDHIVTLIHGFKTSQEASTAQYEIVAERVTTEFAKHDQSVVVVGLQWDSVAKGFLLTLPGKYKKKTLLARKTGRLGARQLLLGLQDAFPESKQSIMAHSMGCELSAAALNLDIHFDEATEALHPHRPDDDLHMTGVIFCGADLDFDVLLGSKKARISKTKFIWLTMSELLGDNRDSILDLRKIIRGRALGSTLPRMTTKQFDTALGQKRMLFDRKHIPLNHALLQYYKPHRLTRIIPSIIYYGDPSAIEKPEDIAAVDEVLALQGNTPALLPYLDHPLASARIYSLWALERITCGAAHHLGDGYLQDVELTLRQTPRKDRLRRKHSRCHLLREGYFPTEKMLERAGAPKWAE